MTVRELIAKLQQLAQDKDILIEGYNFGKISTFTDIDNKDFYVIEGKKWI